MLAGSLFGCSRDVAYPEGLSWGEPPLSAYIGQARLGISNNGDDSLSFVSLDTGQPGAAAQLLGTALVGNNPIELEGPHHLAASSDGQFLFFNLSNYVTGGGSGPHGAHGTGTVPGSLIKWDVRTQRKVGEVLVDRSPGDVIVSRDGTLAIVSHYDLARLADQLTRGRAPEEGYSTVAIVDTASMRLLSNQPVCPTAHGLGLSPTGKQLYITCALSDELATLDISDPARPVLTSKVKVGSRPGPLGNPSYTPYALTVHSDGSIWVSNNKSGDVRVFDPTRPSDGPQRIIPVGGVAMFSDFSSDGKTLYVPRQQDDRLVAIDVATGTTRDLLLPAGSCLNAHVAKVLPQSPVLTVICEGDHQAIKGTALSIDTAAWKIRSVVPLGLFSDGVTLLPALN